MPARSHMRLPEACVFLCTHIDVISVPIFAFEGHVSFSHLWTGVRRERLGFGFQPLKWLAKGPCTYDRPFLASVCVCEISLWRVFTYAKCFHSAPAVEMQRPCLLCQSPRDKTGINEWLAT